MVGSVGHQIAFMFFILRNIKSAAWPHMLLYIITCRWVKISGGKLAPVRHLTDIMDWTVLWRTVMCMGELKVSHQLHLSKHCASTTVFPRVLTFTKLSFPLICSPITALAISHNILFLLAHLVSLVLLIDWEWTQECEFQSTPPSLSLGLCRFLHFFSVHSLKTIFVGTSCLNLIVFIPAEHLRNKYFEQRKEIEPAILRVSISSLVSPYRMGNCVCVLHHFKLTAFHLMERIIHRWRNRLQKVRVTADVPKAH